MRAFRVELPVAGVVAVKVMANSKEEAVNKAFAKAVPRKEEIVDLAAYERVEARGPSELVNHVFFVEQARATLEVKRSMTQSVYDPSVDAFREVDEQYVTEYGEQYRKLIESALEWLNQQEPKWGLSRPTNRAPFVRDLVKRAKKGERTRAKLEEK